MEMRMNYLDLIPSRVMRELLERVREGLYVDYSDASLTVEFLCEDGSFSHDHLSPINLERVDVDSIEPVGDG